MSADLMDDFPPSRDRLVTLANWRKAPFSAWGFRNVRRLIPTANIAASSHAAGLEMSLEEIGHIGFNGHDGNPTTISRALAANGIASTATAVCWLRSASTDNSSTSTRRRNS
jgi:hypothetical protein